VTIDGGSRPRFPGRFADVVGGALALCWLLAAGLGMLAGVVWLALIPWGMAVGAGLSPGRPLAWPLAEALALDGGLWSVAIACLVVAYGIADRKRWGWRLAVVAHGVALAAVALTARALDPPVVLVVAWLAGGLGFFMLPAIHRTFGAAATR